MKHNMTQAATATQTTRAILMAVALLAAIPAMAMAAPTVELLSETAVSGNVVRLSDVAIVQGDGSDLLTGQIICPAPAEGETLLLSAERVRRRLLALSGRADIAISGAPACRIGKAAAATRTATEPDTGRTLRQTLLAHITTSVSRPAERLRVEFDDRDAELLAATETHYIFRLRGDSPPAIGSNSITVDVYEADRPQRLFRTSHIRFRVLLLEDVVVTVRDIRPGEILKAEDVRLERREFSSDDLSRNFRDPQHMVGATARVAMAAGKVVDIGDLSKTLLVQRGSAVTVYVEARGLTVRTISRALESGELGDVVAVQGKEGRGQFYAEVIGSATVRVRMAGAEAQAAASPASDDNQSVSMARRR